MKNQVADLDKKIQNAVKEEFEKVPSAPLSKDEAWQMIQERLTKESGQKQSFFSQRYLRWIGVAAAIVIIVSAGLLFQSQNSSAFGWITKYLTQSYGNVTQMQSSIKSAESSSAAADKSSIPPPSASQGHVAVITKKKMSLSEAKSATNFTMAVPKKIPENLDLQNITVWFVEDHKKSDKVVLYYEKKGKKVLSIQELYVEHEAGFGTTVDNEDTQIKQVSINGEQGTLFIFKNGDKRLIWNRMRTHIELKSDLPKGTVLSIARSM